ncbi:hypothetical protein [Pseudomonas botevensis]|uniref:hypothetical protein n=1 Tax=Pseudomonas botevensis TaxID=2842352 RepID=UPI001C3C7911|nr:hypothetical protein [Pseudomonas botevensis]MBV4472856.1 hypothetical protein [Pseudomonas botevensis]
MKNVYLINNVKSGGKTYLEYLIPALNSLRNTYNCIVLQTDQTGLSRQEAEEILDYPVEQVGVEVFSNLASEIVISNDAWVGRLLDDSNFGIFITHGNVGMPTKDEYYYSELTSYWDVVIASSRSGFDLVKTGLQRYRVDRKKLKCLIADGIALRSDMRKTTPVATLPVKIPGFFDVAPASNKTSGDYVVGLLPTQLGICPGGASLYENLQVVINAVKSQVAHAKFILRPYMTDLAHPTLKDLCSQLAAYDWITLDKPGTSSTAFYQQCDTIITDASTGGVSFMLNSGKLPIYYVPTTEQNNPTVDIWLQQMNNLLPIAKNSEELKELALGFSLLTPADSYFIYKKFYETQYSNLPLPQDVFHDLIENQHESMYCQSTIDSFGNITERD